MKATEELIYSQWLIMAGDLPDFPDFRFLCILVHRRLGRMLICYQDYRFDEVGVMPTPIRDLR